MGRQPITPHICARLVLYLCFWPHLAQCSPDNLADAEQHAARATALVQQGNLKNAEMELREAVRLSPDDPAYLGFLGAVLGMEQMRLFEQLKAKEKKGTATLAGAPRPARTE